MRYWIGMIALWFPLLAGAGQDPREMLEKTAQQMLAVLQERDSEFRRDPESLNALVNDLLVPHVDLEAVSRWVLGKYWRSATPDQRSRFAQEFTKMLIRFYSSALLEYADFKFRFFPVKMKEGARRVVVRSEVMRAGGESHHVNYSLIRRGDEWKVYDVTIDGISVVTTYRSSFTEEIRKNGIDGLIEKMANWNRQGKLPEKEKTGG